ncbi:MAG: hypothetical protein HY721_09070 [Planctomycetes bacterium]|nr:hypothetical protein [Planctomycetota bacterium]
MLASVAWLLGTVSMGLSITAFLLALRWRLEGSRGGLLLLVGLGAYVFAGLAVGIAWDVIHVRLLVESAGSQGLDLVGFLSALPFCAAIVLVSWGLVSVAREAASPPGAAEPSPPPSEDGVR